MPAALNAARIRARLAGTRMPADPLDVDFTHLGQRLPEAAVQRMRPGLRAAGVLVPLIDRAGELQLLLTERAADLRHHAGQVSFPGGGMETGDADILETALREAREEVGLLPSQVEVAGYVAPTATITGFAVTGVVGFVDPGFEPRPDPYEVDTVFEVPFRFLMDERNARYSERVYEGRPLAVATFEYDGHRIWGATAGIILALRDLIY